MADVLSPEQRSFCMSQIRGKNTKPEHTLRRALWRLGYRYRVNFKVVGKPDFVFPGKRVAVFVDGCFWHCCPKHFQAPKINSEFWQKKLNRNVERDKEVTILLQQDDWKVVRIWEHQIKDDLASCVNLIAEIIAEDRFSGLH